MFVIDSEMVEVKRDNCDWRDGAVGKSLVNMKTAVWVPKPHRSQAQLVAACSLSMWKGERIPRASWPVCELCSVGDLAVNTVGGDEGRQCRRWPSTRTCVQVPPPPHACKHIVVV